MTDQANCLYTHADGAYCPIHGFNTMEELLMTTDAVEYFECPFHHVQVAIEAGDRVGCAECITYYDSLTQADAEAMTGDERAEELRRILEAPTTCSMGVFWPWVDMLVGRGVYTHEFAMPEALYNEAKNRIHPDRDGIVARAQALIGTDNPVIVVDNFDAFPGGA